LPERQDPAEQADEPRVQGGTVGYTVTGSSSHAGLLEFIRQNNLDVKPVSIGNMPATFTQTMTGQIDVGFASPPFGIEALEDGKIRLIARGLDVTALKGRTTRVNVTSLDVLAKRKGTLERFMQAIATPSIGCIRVGLLAAGGRPLAQQSPPLRCLLSL
jgi:ABC-type nitrate/sulfonate/bicarbonate transport system substrate-binding protein